MNDKMKYYWAQSPSFKTGFSDYLDRKVYGRQFDARMNADWQRGWKWAELNT